MSKVYLALQGTSYTQGTKILGVFSSEEAAVGRCLRHPTYVWGAAWIKDNNLKNRWTNGETLFVKVEEHDIE